MYNRAAIKGGASIITKDSVVVNANSNNLNVEAKSNAAAVQVGFVVVDVVNTHALIEDMLTTAKIESANIRANKNVWVQAYAEETNLVSSPGVPTLTVSGLDTKVVKAKATVENKTTEAGAGDESKDINSDITAGETASFVAEGTTITEAQSSKTGETSVSFAKVGSYEFLITVNKHDTLAYVNDRVLAKGSILVKAYDKVTGYSELNGTTVAAVEGGTNRVTQNVSNSAKVSIGKNAVVEAIGNVELRAVAHIRLDGIINTKDIGILGAFSAISLNITWTRRQDISIGNGARLASRYGNIRILSGDNKNPISLRMRKWMAAVLLPRRGPKTYVTVNSASKVNVGGKRKSRRCSAS